MKKHTIILIVLVLGVCGIWYVVSGRAPSSEPDERKVPFLGTTPTKVGTEINYTDPTGAFSFGYFAPYVLTFLADTTGDTLLLQENGKGIQIYISDYTLKSPLTASIVKKELQSERGETLSNLKDITMPGGFPAVTFSSKTAAGEAGGTVWDVWFVQDQMLYQITADPNTDDLLKKLVETFTFEE